LGAKTGPAIAYQWLPPTSVPRFLPALALLLLLLPKRNRCWQALWVAAPVALSFVLQSLFWAIPGIVSGAPDGVVEVFSTVPFGLAAVWLLSPYLKVRGRFLTFLMMLAAMLAFSLFALAMERPRDEDGGAGYMFVIIAVLELVLSVALNLAGWSCRKRFGRHRFARWLILWLLAGWAVFFAVMSALEGPGPVLEMGLALVITCAVSLGLLLPFLLLCFANGFYRERLREVLRLAAPAPPAAPGPPTPDPLTSVAPERL
jgi:hypothetical protein